MAETIASGGAYKGEVAEGTAVSRHRIVTFDSNAKFTHCGAANDAAGVSLNEMPAAAADRANSGNVISVCSLTDPRALRLVASAAIAVGAVLEKAADGKVATFSAGEKIGRMAITSAAADGDTVITIPAVHAGL